MFCIIFGIKFNIFFKNIPTSILTGSLVDNSTTGLTKHMISLDFMFSSSIDNVTLTHLDRPHLLSVHDFESFKLTRKTYRNSIYIIITIDAIQLKTRHTNLIDLFKFFIKIFGNTSAKVFFSSLADYLNEFAFICKTLLQKTASTLVVLNY